MADGAGGTENGESFQSIDYNSAVACGTIHRVRSDTNIADEKPVGYDLKPLLNHLRVPQHGSGKQQGVDAVEHASVAGQQVA